MTELNNLEKESFFDDDFDRLPPSDIVAYNELRSCADLLRMYDDKMLDIQPEFQRDIIWSPASQTRFIDSLIKQLPIPSMCFGYDYKTERWQVIDGLQRISAIIRFLTDDKWKLSKLKDINHDLAGMSVEEIKKSKKLSKYFNRVKNITLPITVLRCDYGKKAHKLYLFTIFHRLNTGGMKLNNQEIRNCVYNGKLNSLLKNLDNDKNWRILNKMQPHQSYRFTKQELILRFFALYDNLKNYSGKLAQFLNEYMSDNQNPDNTFLKNKEHLFKTTVKIITEGLYQKNPEHKLSNTILEALLYGVAKNINSLQSKNTVNLKKYYTLLKKEKAFSDESLKEGLAGKEKVKKRLNTSKLIFSDR